MSDSPQPESGGHHPHHDCDECTGRVAAEARRRRAEPTTCREAAARFREWAHRTQFESHRHQHDARAEILEAFGDAAVPQAILDAFEFTGR